MTIVEREQLDVQVDERERRASVLEAAALEIEVRGWTNAGQCSDDAGRVCMMMAINEAGPFEHYDWFGVIEEWDPLWHDQWPGYGEAALMPLAAWNDVHARDAADVTFVLRWRAQEIRDGR